MCFFWVAFPFSLPACRALYGWAGRLTVLQSALALLPAVPVCLCLAAVQLVAQLVAVLSLVLFALFGSLYAICAYGAAAAPKAQHRQRCQRRRSTTPAARQQRTHAGSTVQRDRCGSSPNSAPTALRRRSTTPAAGRTHRGGRAAPQCSAYGAGP
jgi:hypothetical protein